jgi:hypothetical protein
MASPSSITIPRSAPSDPWRSDERTISSSAHPAAASPRPSPIPSSRPPSSTASIRKPGSPTCWPISRIQRLPILKTSCLGLTPSETERKTGPASPVGRDGRTVTTPRTRYRYHPRNCAVLVEPLRSDVRKFEEPSTHDNAAALARVKKVIQRLWFQRGHTRSESIQLPH